MITLNISDIPTLILSVLLVFVIVLIAQAIGFLKDLRKVIQNNERYITNTMERVDKVTEETVNIISKTTEKANMVLNFIKKKKDDTSTLNAEEQEQKNVVDTTTL